MILFYTKGYHAAFVRFLHSFFVQMPLMVWFRFASPRLLFWRNKPFWNHTGLTDAQLQSIWNAAAQQLATQPIPLSTNGTNLLPPSPKALAVAPENVAVMSMPDWSVADLAKIDPAWAGHAVPTGAFAANAGLNYETVAGITMEWKRPRIYGAASVLPTVLVWEFQNVILGKLGYNVSGR
jgi:hypothetical protein